MSNENENTFHISAAPNGSVRLKITKSGQVVVDIPLPNDNAGIVAALLLAAAKDSVVQATQNSEPIAAKVGEIHRMNILPSQVSLASSQRQDHETIAFACGNAHIGFDLPRDQIRALGEALLALSASGTVQ